MQRFGYARAASIADAIELLTSPGYRSLPLAGGTDLLLQLRADASFCDRVVDVSRIPDLRSIERRGEDVIIGAAVTFSEVIASECVGETGAVLTQACQQVGAVQVRNMGTLGGNVANAAACADSLPALVCLDARARVVTSTEDYELPVSELILGPNRTKIPQGGLLVSLHYTVPTAGNRSVFLKVGRRNAMAISRLTIAAMGRLSTDGRIAEARFVPGSTTPTLSRFRLVEELLTGEIPGKDLFQAAGKLAVQEMARMAGRRWSSEYKEPVLSAMTVRALAKVFLSVPEWPKGRI